MKQSEINKIIARVEKAILEGKKQKVSDSYNWTKGFPEEAGVYGVFDQGKLIYIGETANIRSRMKEFKRTYNHSLRRLLGWELYKKKRGTAKKFDDPTEQLLNDYYVKNLVVSLVPVNFGRLEIETYFIHNKKYKLLNKTQKRSKPST